MTKTAGGSKAKQTSSASDEGYSDALLAEVLDKMTDAPMILAMHQLNRRKRADLTRSVVRLMPQVQHMEQLLKGGNEISTLANGVDVMDLLADVEELLAGLAVDRDEFTVWAQKADDNQLLALFVQFVGTFARGEASSSSI